MFTPLTADQIAKHLPGRHNQLNHGAHHGVPVPKGMTAIYRGIILDAHGWFGDDPSDEKVLSRLRTDKSYGMGLGEWWSKGFGQAEDFAVGEASLSYVWSMGMRPHDPVYGVVLEAHIDAKPVKDEDPFVLSALGEDAVLAPGAQHTHAVYAHLYRMEPGEEPRKRTFLRTIKVPDERLGIDKITKHTPYGHEHDQRDHAPHRAALMRSFLHDVVGPFFYGGTGKHRKPPALDWYSVFDEQMDSREKQGYSSFRKPEKINDTGAYFIPMSADPDSGDGYFFTSSGKRLWGRYGAAGAMIRSRNDDGVPVYLLAQRSKAITGGGGTWAIPGGALERDEHPEDGALREMTEEIGPMPHAAHPNVVDADVNPVEDGWAYTTVLMEVDHPYEAKPQDWETEKGGVGWFTQAQVMNMNLHPAVKDRLGVLFGLWNKHDGPKHKQTREAPPMTWQKDTNYFDQPVSVADTPVGKYVIDGNGAGKMKWSVKYPDGDYALGTTKTQVTSDALLDYQERWKQQQARQERIDRIVEGKPVETKAQVLFRALAGEDLTKNPGGGLASNMRDQLLAEFRHATGYKTYGPDYPSYSVGKDYVHVKYSAGGKPDEYWTLDDQGKWVQRVAKHLPGLHNQHSHGNRGTAPWLLDGGGFLNENEWNFHKWAYAYNIDNYKNDYDAWYTKTYPQDAPYLPWSPPDEKVIQPQGAPDPDPPEPTTPASDVDDWVDQIIGDAGKDPAAATGRPSIPGATLNVYGKLPDGLTVVDKRKDAKDAPLDVLADKMPLIYELAGVPPQAEVELRLETAAPGKYGVTQHLGGDKFRVSVLVLPIAQVKEKTAEGNYPDAALYVINNSLIHEMRHVAQHYVYKNMDADYTKELQSKGYDANFYEKEAWLWGHLADATGTKTDTSDYEGKTLTLPPTSDNPGGGKFPGTKIWAIVPPMWTPPKGD